MTALQKNKTSRGYVLPKEKDPVIGVMLSLVYLETRVHSQALDHVLRSTAKEAGVSYGCLVGWFYGATISPKFSTLQRVARALGVEFVPQPYHKRSDSRH